MKTPVSLLFFILFSTSLWAQLPTNGLVAHYKFENSVADSSGYDRNGTIFGNPTYVEGFNGKALSFDGINDYVRIFNSDDLVLQSFSISAWVRWEGDPDLEGSWAIISNWYGGSYFQHYGLRMGTIAPGIPYNHAVLFYDDGSEWDWVYGYKEELSDGKWHLITGVLQAGEYAKVYFDNHLVGIDLTSIPNQINPTGDLFIARDGYGDGLASNPCDRWHGSIDEIRIYNRVLTGDEITDIYEDIPSAVSEIENNKDGILFPNPTNGLFSIQSKDAQQIKVFDITGKNILNLIPQNSIEQIDLSYQPKGVYFVNIISKNKNEVKKLIIE